MVEVVVQLIAVTTAEFIFFGSYFDEIEIYSKVLKGTCIALIITGVFVHGLNFIRMLLDLTCYPCCLKRCESVIRLTPVIFTGIICFFVGVITLAKRGGRYDGIVEEIGNYCFTPISSSLSSSLPLSSSSPPPPSSSSSSLPPLSTSLLSLPQTFASLLSSSSSPSPSLPSSSSSSSSFVSFNSTHNVREQCLKYRDAVYKAYGCSLSGVTGNSEECNAPMETALKFMASVADGVQKMVGLCSFLVFCYTQILSFFLYLSLCISLSL